MANVVPTLTAVVSMLAAAGVCCAAPEASSTDYDIRSFGANGDGRFDNTKVFAAAIEACAAAGGGTVHVPAGTYRTGSIFLKSHVTLHIAAGATIAGSTDWGDYPIVDTRWEGVDRPCYASLIQAVDCDRVAVVGRGTIDGRGEVWWQPHRRLRDRWRAFEAEGVAAPPPGREAEWEEARKGSYPRPRLVEFLRCTNVYMEGVTLKDSAAWTLHPVYCDNVTIDGLTILAPPNSRNTDGCNPDSSRNVRIANCHIDVGDDCIAIKSGRDEDGRRVGRPAENIAIANCTMIHGHGGVVIGSEMAGGVRNVAVGNCVFHRTERGIRLKTMRGRGGTVENIRVADIVMQDVPAPIVLDMFYNPAPEEPASERTPRLRNIQLSGIVAEGAHTAVALRGLPEMPIRDVSITDTRISTREGAVCSHVEGLAFRNVTINADGRRALVLEHVAGLELDRFTTQTPAAAQPVAWLYQVRDAFIHGCRAPAGTGTFLELGGADTRAVRLAANHLAEATAAVVLGDDVPRGELHQQ